MGHILHHQDLRFGADTDGDGLDDVPEVPAP